MLSVWRLFMTDGTKETELITIPNTKNKVRRKLISILPSLSTSEPKIKLRKRAEVDKHQENISTILLNSNATPIRRKESVGYACCFCSMAYPEAKDLKTHTIADHDDKIKSIFMKSQNMSTYMVKLDITSLSCNICSTNFDVLDDLIIHLTLKHNKYFHKGMKSYILPFKFETEEIRCVLCKTKFNFFKTLVEHMNSHFRNHVCVECGEGFVNKRILLNHSYRHKKGVFNCTHCDKVFDARVKQKEHERAVHLSMNKRYKCGYCGEKFTDYTKRNEHQVKEHGVKPVVLLCKACNRSFDNQRALTVHTKSYHLLEGRVKK